MEIIKVESLDQMTDGNVYYECNGRFYARCWACGKPVEIDHHRTAADLRRDEISEETYFCGEDCERAYLKDTCPTLADACVTGNDRRYRELVIRHGIKNYLRLAKEILSDLNLLCDDEDVEYAEDHDWLTINTGRDGEMYMWYSDGDHEVCRNIRTCEDLTAEEIKANFC